jgi:hypothetical protein
VWWGGPARLIPTLTPTFTPTFTPTLTPTLPDVRWDGYRLDIRGTTHPFDPDGSHMLVSETKPCKSKYIPLYGETADGSLNQL